MGSNLVFDHSHEVCNKDLNAYIINTMRSTFEGIRKFEDPEFVIKLSELTQFVTTLNTIVLDDVFNRDMDASEKELHLRALTILVDVLVDMLEWKQDMMIVYWR